MIRVIVSIACCALIAPLASASPKQRTQTTTASVQGITITGTTIITVDKAEASAYQPQNTLLVYNDKDPARYVLEGPGHVVNRKGEIVRTAVRPGASVHVYFASTGGVRTIDHVVVD